MYFALEKLLVWMSLPQVSHSFLKQGLILFRCGLGLGLGLGGGEKGSKL